MKTQDDLEELESEEATVGVDKPHKRSRKASYLRPSYFNDTLILAIFVSMDLAHINFSDFTKNYSLFKQ